MLLYKQTHQFTDTKDKALEYVERRRGILPAVYNLARSEGRTTCATQSLSTKEYNNALSSGFSAMNHRFVIKTEKFFEEISDLRKRITNYNINGVEGLDDSDIEFLQDEVEGSDSDVEFEALLPRPETVIMIKNDDTSSSQENQVNEPSAERGSSTQAQSNEVRDDDVEANNTMENDAIDDTVAGAIDGTADGPNGGIAAGAIDGTGNAMIEDTSGTDVDILSGDIIFTQTDANDRYFPSFDTAIRFGIVKVLSAWNGLYPFNSNLYDKRFVGVLLREVFGKNYATEPFDEKRISFVKRLFEIRVKDDETRLNDFDKIIEERREKAKTK